MSRRLGIALASTKDSAESKGVLGIGWLGSELMDNGLRQAERANIRSRFSGSWTDLFFTVSPLCSLTSLRFFCALLLASSHVIPRAHLILRTIL
jgi:hypothetical protein